ncbi:MAG: hypothetical protein AAF206_24580 [Bacteroidota bacterium]
MRSLAAIILLFFLAGIGSIRAQEPSPIYISINTQAHDSWEMSGNINVARSAWKAANYGPTVQFVSVEEEFDQLLLEELDHLEIPAVPLGNFSATFHEGKVQVDWISLAGNRAQAFYIQRSPDGNQWEDIGMTKTANDENVVASCHFLDSAPLAGSNFYRLRQVDKSGKISKSDIIAVEVMESGFHVTHMFPSPVIFGASIDLDLRTPARVNIKLRDTNEAELATIYSDYTSVGRHSVELNLDSLPKGLYVCEIEVGDSVSKRTFVK